MSLPPIALSALHCAAHDAARIQATHVLSLIDPDAKAPNCELPEDRHLVLRFHDVTSGVGQGPAWVEPPMGGHVAKIIEFAQNAGPDAQILVHCHMGIVRSPAAIMIIAAAITGTAQAAEECLKALDPKANTEPNSRMIQMADRQLRLQGELIAAVDRLNRRRPEIRADHIW